MTEPRLLGLLDFCQLLIEAVEACGAEYMLGGALAVMAYAEARATQDVDIVVHLPAEKAAALSAQLEERDVLIPTEIILERFAAPGADLPLSGIHLHSGQRADIYLLQPGDQLREEAMRRRHQVDLGAPLHQVFVHAPEDLILYKLRYFAISEQDKHVRDIAAIVLAQEERLDMGYIDRWVETLGLYNYWQIIQQEIEARRSKL
ncbi:MAG: hypothetical protein DWQ07_17710 [Chloroflexi bacterium]|nr:MAG: hypothetical protein DWQ07_17710 [Chloroflexota bacterium]